MKHIFRYTALWIIAALTAVFVAGQPARALAQIPAEGPRVAAEWEPAVGVLIAWPLMIPKALVVELAKDVTVHVMVRDQASAQTARQTMIGWGIDPKRIECIVTAQAHTYCWTRDWGPFAVFDKIGPYRLIDGRFLGYPRSGLDSSKGLIKVTYMPQIDTRADDEAPAAIAAALGLPRTELPIALTGGNIVFDGLGTAVATQILADENVSLGVSRDRFVRLLKTALGVEHFHELPNFESNMGNQHADCLLKMLDEERILVKRAPADYPDAPHIEAVVKELSKLTNVYGRPYTILRIDTPRYFNNFLANYTNSLILNGKIYVPLFGIPGDAQALQTFRDAMPGYEVLGFKAAPGAAWKYSDALHCRTRAIWDPKMLFLAHKRLDPVVPAAAEYPIKVHIRDYSGAGLIDEKLQLKWRTAGSPKWTTVALKPLADKNTYGAVIAGLQPGQVVEYYLSAASQSGRQETLPRTAPRGFFAFRVAQQRETKNVWKNQAGVAGAESLRSPGFAW